MSNFPPKYPGFGLSLSHIPGTYGMCFPNAIDYWVATPLTVRERTMMALMDQITDKPDWDRKVFDEDITNKWRREAQDSEVDISDKMLDWIIPELRDKARSFSMDGLVPTFDMDVDIIKSDIVISSSLADALRQASAHLSDIPDKDKDWHPGSDNKVVDLVHPSLFPLIYGRSRVLPSGGTVKLKSCVNYIGEGETLAIPPDSELPVDDRYRPHYESKPPDRRFWSKNFQWLPCNVAFADAEGVRITSYINNLHPAEHAELYQVIEQIISRSIPSWDKTLSSTKTHREPRIQMETTTYTYPQGEDMPEDYMAESDEDEYDRQDAWVKATRLLDYPEPEKYQSFEQPANTRVDLRSQFSEQGLQVIVKLANIELNPEKPDYEGGSWHVEGQLNEHICASTLYYYDSENITESFLAFRHKADGDDFEMKEFDQEDYSGVEEIYGVEQDGDKLQELGRVATPQGRLLTFPNVLQHKVSPFSLEDRSRPGHRKILALFLVDPHIPILSTANVPPQQREWWSKKLQDEDILGMLPRELADKVIEGVDGFPISLHEAKEIRLEVIEERKAYVEDVDNELKQSTFSFCEH